MKKKINNYWLIANEKSSSISKVEDEKTIRIIKMFHGQNLSKTFNSIEDEETVEQFIGFVNEQE